MGFREELAADAAELEAGGRLRILREISPEGHGLCRSGMWDCRSGGGMPGIIRNG